MSKSIDHRDDTVPASTERHEPRAAGEPEQRPSGADRLRCLRIVSGETHG